MGTEAMDVDVDEVTTTAAAAIGGTKVEEEEGEEEEEGAEAASTLLEIVINKPGRMDQILYRFLEMVLYKVHQIHNNNNNNNNFTSNLLCHRLVNGLIMVMELGCRIAHPSSINPSSSFSHI